MTHTPAARPALGVKREALSDKSDHRTGHLRSKTARDKESARGAVALKALNALKKHLHPLRFPRRLSSRAFFANWDEGV
jgi:hypothetical protein